MTLRPPRPTAWLFAALLGLHLAPGRAEAYLDPGAGSFMLQMLLAGILGLMLTLKMFWRRLKAAVRHLFRGRRENEGE